MAEPLFSGRKIKGCSSASSIGEPNCIACGLDRHCKSPKLGVTGKGGKGILLIGEAPGGQEDKHGDHFLGEGGTYLARILKKKGIDIDKDCWKIDAINCKPPGRRPPFQKK